MSSFVSSPAAAAAPADEQVLEHDGAFFPGIKASAVKAIVRVPSQVTDARLIDATLVAMATVGAELEAFKLEQIALGLATLAAVRPTDKLGGQPRLVRLYERAIASFAAAELVETHNDISASADGQKRLEERALTADEHRRNGTHAVRDILGATRTAVELI